MLKHRIVMIAVAAGLCGALAPLVAGLQIAHFLASREQQARLEEIAQYTVTRTRRLVDRTVRTLAALKPDGLECSSSHRDRLRTAMFDDPFVDDIGYYRHGRLVCSAWGIPPADSQEARIDYRTAAGVDIGLPVRPWASPRHNRMLIQFGDYGALFDYNRLNDFPREHDVRLMVRANNGVLITDKDWGIDKPLPVFEPGSSKVAIDGIAYAKATDADWTALAAQIERPRAAVFSSRTAWILPIVIGLSCLITWLVVAATRRRLSPLGELEAALKADRLLLHYQPIIDLGTGRCFGAEALVRMELPDGSLRYPDHFVELAEANGLSSKITRNVVRRAVREMSGFLRANRDFHLALNLSAKDLSCEKAIGEIDAVLKQGAISPTQIWFELTEHAIITQTAHRAIATARALGYAVTIDDFGTGYCSLKYLNDLPVNGLKIDKSFVQTINLFPGTPNITSVIIELAKLHKLAIVAEGIETKEQAEFLRESGVQYGQGWLYSKALPFAAFQEFYRKSSPGPHLNDP